MGNVLLRMGTSKVSARISVRDKSPRKRRKGHKYAKEQTKSQIQSKIKSQHIPAQQQKFGPEIPLATRGQE